MLPLRLDGELEVLLDVCRGHGHERQQGWRRSPEADVAAADVDAGQREVVKAHSRVQRLREAVMCPYRWLQSPVVRVQVSVGNARSSS